MADRHDTQWQPDWLPHPGETLRETLDALGMSQAELARRAGRPKKTISAIVNGMTAITPETALQLEHVTGVEAGFWMNLQRRYETFQARKAEAEKLAGWTDWLQQFPLTEMVRREWIALPDEAVDRIRTLLDFFGVSDPPAWERRHQRLQKREVAYRQSTAVKIDEYALSAWLRQGERLALQIDTGPFNAEAFRDCLSDIRDLTIEPFQTAIAGLQSLCAEWGVAVVLLEALPNTGTWGATRWLKPDKALVQLALRYKTDDHFWFSFFHEAAHVLEERKTQIVLDSDEKAGGVDPTEQKADAFASDFLIPPEYFEEEFGETAPRGRVSKERIRQFARRLGIAPGIVVGRLQHEGILRWNFCNDLKHSLNYSEKQ